MKRILTGLIIGGLIIVCWSVWYRQDGLTIQNHQTIRASQLVRQQSSDLTRHCAAKHPVDGFTKTFISGDVHLDVRGSLASPACQIILRPGARLTLTGRLDTGKLLITDLANSPEPSTVKLLDISLAGRSAAGLQISLHALGSQLIVERSQLNYPLSVGLAVGNGDADLTATLSLVDNIIISDQPISEGIILASTGRAIVNGNTFRPTSKDSVLLLAPNCQAAHNQGVILGCR